MADRIAIFDSEVALGAIVDTDTMRALGPVGGGPNAREELTQFIAQMPEAIWKLSTYDLAEAWMQFWSENFAALYDEPKPSPALAVVEPPSPGNDGAALAELEARADAGEPPPPQPADTDMEADAGTPNVVGDDELPSGDNGAAADTEPPPYEGPCFACNGTGRVPSGNPDQPVVCNLCKGSGNLPAPTAA